MQKSNITKLFFTPAQEGETVEIAVVGYYKSADGKTVLPCIQKMSDYKWQLNCLIDRLFHPYKYAKEFNEDVQEHIRYLIKWLSEHCKPELKENVLTELNELVKYVSELDSEYKRTAELYIKDYFKGVR